MPSGGHATLYERVPFVRLARPVTYPSIHAPLRSIACQLHDVDAQFMLSHVEQHRAVTSTLLRDVAGIGCVTATTSIAELPELDHLNLC